jgi:hypothetical protein
MAGAVALRVRVSISTNAAHIASSHFAENYVPPLHELWALTNFYESVILHGTEATREKFAKPADERKTVLVAVK